MLTALSLRLRPRESGQLSTIIPHNHVIPYCLSNSCGLTVIYPVLAPILYCFSADIALFSADIALF